MVVMTLETITPLAFKEKIKVNVYGVNGNVVGEIELPELFNVPIRRDLIRRAFLSAFTAMLQPKGRDPLAGKRTTAKYWGVGYGLARVPRLPNGTARFVVSTRKGHAAFPPRPDERIHEEVNKKERVMAIISALAATSRPELVRERGHVFTPGRLPVIIVDEAESSISKTTQVREYLEKIGLWSDVERSLDGMGIRAGRGKMRGRTYVEPRSILFIVSSYSIPLAKAVRNLPGVDIATPGNLSILHLAPGGVPGRLTVISMKALNELASKYRVRPL
ncbi:50S ribosomal protein L4P [Desulfurococcus amylolyticus 1221n]|uniref:Large ribosomal subunit protein uL4 n=2 Tax=Desulfurococcaceae TaxID=2272 RepID=B8D5X1_DESA1|nr:50S ribosomal protein L4P [Desulfurococcus amylolyticus 1221n]